MLTPQFTKLALVALVVLLLIDMVLIGLNLWHVWGERDHPVPDWVTRDSLDLKEEGGVAEQVNYVKLSIGAAALLVAAVRDRAAVFAAWALVVAVAVADDAFELHEGWGYDLATELNFPGVFGLDGWDLGELLIWMGMAAILLPLLVLTHRASDRAARAVSWQLVALVALVAVVAVGGDMLHAAVRESFAAGTVMTLVEDGGEILLSTVIVAVVVAAATARSVPTAPLSGAVNAWR